MNKLRRDDSTIASNLISRFSMEISLELDQVVSSVLGLRIMYIAAVRDSV